MRFSKSLNLQESGPTFGPSIRASKSSEFEYSFSAVLLTLLVFALLS